jgi:hypothetical protein
MRRKHTLGSLSVSSYSTTELPWRWPPSSGLLAPCSLVEVYRRFEKRLLSLSRRWPIMEAKGMSKMSVNFYQTTQRNNPQKTAIFILAAVRTWNLTIELQCYYLRFYVQKWRKPINFTGWNDVDNRKCQIEQWLHNGEAKCMCSTAIMGQYYH